MKKLTQTQLAQLKKELSSLQKELEELLSLEQSATETVELDQSMVGRLSRHDALQQQAIAQSNTSLHKQHLKLIHKAQRKIEEQDYGYCEECGQGIPYPRLQIQPESDYCISCMEKRERDD